MGGDGLGQANQDAGAAHLACLIGLDRAGGGDATVHGLDEALGDGQTQPGTLCAIGRLLHAAEFVEHPFQLRRRNADALILDRDHHGAPVLIGGQFDQGGVVRIGDGIFQNIDDRLFQQGLVDADETELTGEVAQQFTRPQPPRDTQCCRVQHVTHIDPVGTDVQTPALQPGHVQQVADIAVQPLGLLADTQQKVVADLGLQGVAIVDQGGGGPQHRR